MTPLIGISMISYNPIVKTVYFRPFIWGDTGYRKLTARPSTLFFFSITLPAGECVRILR